MGRPAKLSQLPTVLEMQSDLATANRLTLTQIKFINEYISNGGKGAEAAIAAGYSHKTAAGAAWKNLQNPQILKKIDDHVKHALERAEVTFDWKIHMLKQMIYKCISGEGLKGGHADPSALVACISELNKMQGHVVPDKHEHEHIVDVRQVEKMIKQYRKEF